MPHYIETVSRDLGHGFRPPLNPAFANTACALRTDTDNNESGDLAYKTVVVISAKKPIHTCIRRYFPR